MEDEIEATLETLRAQHEALDDEVRSCVRTISNFAATFEVLEQPSRSRLEEAVAETRSCLVQLASWLEDLGDILDDVRGSSERGEDLDVLVELVEQLEPPPGPPPADDPERHEAEEHEQFESASPLHLLSAPYDILLEAEGEMFRERVKRPYLFIELKRIWSDFTYIGEQRTSAGFAARLSLLHEWVDRAREETPDEAPWHPDDLAELRELVDRTGERLDWSREKLEARERDRWVERVSKWISTCESEPETAKNVSEMMTRFVTEVPERRDEKVDALLERIADNEDLSEEVCKSAREQLEE